jgi:hypothetical protein
MSSTKYTAYIGFDNNKNAYKFINKALNTDLGNNYDDYSCDNYEISMDGDMAFVKFNELNKKQIIETMNKIARSLKMDENCFSVTDSNDEEIDIFESEEEKKEDVKEEKKEDVKEEKKEDVKEEKNDCPLTRMGFTKYQVKFIKMMKDYINQMTAEKEKVNRVKIAISMFQFVMANIDLMYTDLLPSNKDKVNSMIKGLIDKAVEVKQQVFASQNLPSDVSSQAILVLDTAHKNMISVYNENK